MIYESAEDWLKAPRKRLLFFGMSGLGKTHLANMLRGAGDWFHYSIDYRIGTRYMGEFIADNAKREAMKVPFLRALLMTDSIYIASNITFDHLAPLAAYLGKPGDPAKGGLPFDEYRRRQDQHHAAERGALLDTGHFIDRAEALYGYPHFVCDTGGSICEVVNPDDPQDPILSHLSARTLMVWIEGSEAHTDALVRRFDRAPKPMCYRADFLLRCWSDYLNQNNVMEGDVDPDAFVRWTYAQALAHRQPLYAGMARWGLTVQADEVAGVQSPADLDRLIGEKLEMRAKAA